jgi:ferredoxin
MSAARVSRRDFLRGRAQHPLSAHALPAPPPAPTPERAHDDEGRVARLTPGSCLAQASQVCTVCVERCAAHHAIRLRGLMPQIDPGLCTGCGLCVEACPAPSGALTLWPRQLVGP